MATQDYTASIQGVGIRVTALDANGNLLNGPGQSYTTYSFIRVSFTPEYEEGDEITEKSANGAVCVTFKSPDTLKRITMELAICEPDPEITGLISGGVMLSKNLGTFAEQNNKTVGWASPAVGDDPSGNGVAVEVWSRAIADGKPAATLPFYQFIFPYTKLRISGDRVIENGLLATTFEGYGLGNSEFESGLDERWEWPTVTDRPYAYARTSWAPSGLKGFYTWHGELTASISNVALSSNVATITTSTDHEFEPGDVVTIAGLTSGNAVLNGTYTILSTPTGTTFTYAKTETNISSVAATGTATVATGPRAVTELDSAFTDDQYNVPGNVDYNADIEVDNVVGSVEDPTS